MSHRGGTYGDEVLCSSPMGSLLEISTDNVQQKTNHKNEGDGAVDLLDQDISKLRQSKESEMNVYSFNPIATQDLMFESSKVQSNKKRGGSNVISLSSEGERPISQDLNEEDPDQDSGLLEISQKDFLNSQKFKHESPDLISDVIIETGGTTAGASSSQVYYELKSAQTPHSSPGLNYDQIRSSSPIMTQHETQPTSSQHIPPLLPDSGMDPSAQLTSFRMLSPKKVVSETATPVKTKNLLVTQESFNIPNLLSPTKSSPLKTQRTDAESQSIYCTARQPGTNSPLLKEYEKTTTSVKFKGQVKTKSSSPWTNYETTVIPSKRTNNEVEIPDSSDDENDISIIEITRTTKKPKKSVLQVPSSPGVISPSKTKLLLPIQSSQLDPDFDEVSTEELKRKIIQYGLKPAKSRLKMIDSIKEVNSFLKEESLLKLSQSQNVTDSQNIVKTDVFETINDIISENDKLMEKIYTFEPIESKELQNYLNDRGVVINYDLLKEWCDRNSICLIEELQEKPEKKKKK